MSDQTPNSSDNLNGSDPSMEEILASIRKIISDDEPVALESPEDVANGNMANSASEEGLDELIQGLHKDTPHLTSDAASEGQADFTALEAESVDLNIDDVLAGLDGDMPEFKPADAPVDMADDAAISNVLDEILAEEANVEAAETAALLPEVEDDILSLLEEDIPLVEGTASKALGLTPVIVPDAPADRGGDALSDLTVGGIDTDTFEDITAEAEAENIDDIDALLSGLLGHDDVSLDDASLDDASLDDVSLDDVSLDDVSLDDVSLDDVSLDADDAGVAALNAEPASVGDTEDLDLVKSLMADLADDTESIETEADLEEILAIPEIEDTPVETVSADSDADDDILGDIVNMTIDDEIESHPEELALQDLLSEDLLSEDLAGKAEPADQLAQLEDVVEAEQANIAENAQLDAEAVALDAVEDVSPSLSDIAAAAEADAVAVETAAMPAIAASAGIGALAGIAAISASAADETPAVEVAVAQDEPAEIIIETPPISLSTQETEMPVKAVKTDAILDDVTQSASAGAFAELNQVVEDRAIFNERGPRIGDLVQEALRPMLKDWLDEHLKGIVERAVAKEVKRISEGK